jgi:hypothetical protein
VGDLFEFLVNFLDLLFATDGLAQEAFQDRE